MDLNNIIFSENIGRRVENIAISFIKIKNAGAQTVTCSSKYKPAKYTEWVICGERGMQGLWQLYKELLF